MVEGYTDFVIKVISHRIFWSQNLISHTMHMVTLFWQIRNSYRNIFTVSNLSEAEIDCVAAVMHQSISQPREITPNKN